MMMIMENGGTVYVVVSFLNSAHPLQLATFASGLLSSRAADDVVLVRTVPGRVRRICASFLPPSSLPLRELSQLDASDLDFQIG